MLEKSRDKKAGYLKRKIKLIKNNGDMGEDRVANDREER